MEEKEENKNIASFFISVWKLLSDVFQFSRPLGFSHPVLAASTELKDEALSCQPLRPWCFYLCICYQTFVFHAVRSLTIYYGCHCLLLSSCAHCKLLSHGQSWTDHKIRVEYCDEQYSNKERQAHLSSKPEGKNRKSKGHKLCFLSTMGLSYYLELIPFNSVESKL